MTASESSLLGLAKQSTKGTPIAVDASFQYMLFNEGAVAPNTVMLPLDPEVGGGAFLRNLVKVGVTSAGVLTFIPRPKSIGHLLMGVLGKSAAPTGAGTAKTHVLTVDPDQFKLPYYTLRSAPGKMWGEIIQDVRVASLGLSWKAANFLRGQVAFMGGSPTIDEDVSLWVGTPDGGPQFLAAETLIESEVGTTFDGVKVLSGAIQAGMNIPLDEQWITGSYSPDDFDINSRAFVITLAMKVTNKTLYEKMAYDAAAGGAWATAALREGDIAITFKSDQVVEAGTPYSLKVVANGASGSDANVVWSVSPIALRAGRQVTLVATGTFLADPSGATPITATLVNDQATQY
jgi:hypothetical protein